MILNGKMIMKIKVVLIDGNYRLIPLFAILAADYNIHLNSTQRNTIQESNYDMDFEISYAPSEKRSIVTISSPNFSMSRTSPAAYTRYNIDRLIKKINSYSHTL